MGSGDWFMGLMGGLAQGVSQDMLRRQELELQKQRDNINIVKSLIANEQWDVISLLDPKTKKAANITPEFEEGIKPLAAMQKQAKEAKLQQARDQQETNKIAVEEAKRKQAAFQNLTADEQKQADFTGVIKAEDRDADRKLKEAQLKSVEEQRVRQSKLDELKFALDKSQLQLNEKAQLWAHEDRVASIGLRDQQFQAQVTQNKLTSDALADSREARQEATKEKAAAKEKDSVMKQATIASKRIDSIKALAPRDSKTKEPDLLYPTEAEAKAMADRLTKANKEYDKWSNKLSELTGMPPDEETVYTIIPERTTRMGFETLGSTMFRVVPVTKSSLDAQQSKAASGTELRQGGYEHLLAPQTNQNQQRQTPVNINQQTMSIQPQDKQKILLALQRAKRAMDQSPTQDNQTKSQVAAELISAGMDKQLAVQIVDTNKLDILIQQLRSERQISGNSR